MQLLRTKSENQPDLMWDLVLYGRLARADRAFVGPVNWYAPSTNLKTRDVLLSDVILNFVAKVGPITCWELTTKVFVELECTPL
jgi:hypothetical protein